VPLTIAARYGDIGSTSALIVEDKGIRIDSTLPVAVYAPVLLTIFEFVNKFKNCFVLFC
jgi:hypothetical protein